MHFIRSRFVPLLLAHARRRGMDIEAFAERHAVPQELRSPERWSMDAAPLTIEGIERLSRALAAELDDPILGATLGTELGHGAYGVVEFAGRNAPNLREAGRRLVRYQRLISDGIAYAIREEGGCEVLEHRFLGPMEGIPHGNLYTVSALYTFCRQLVGDDLRVTRAEFAHARDGSCEGLSTVFGTDDLVFGVGRNALWFPPGELDRPIAVADPKLLPLLDDYATRLLPPEDPATGWVARVRQHVRRSLPGGAPSLESAAEHLRTSPRNLQRQLAESDTSYSEVVDRLREEEARRLLVETELAVKEIAFLVGYSKPRAFLRAFKRWTGTSPKAYREDNE